MNKEESLTMLSLERATKELITPKMKQLLDVAESNMKFNGLTYDVFVQDLADTLMELTKGADDSSKESRTAIVDKVYDKLIEKYGTSSTPIRKA